jgi:hypothetical protein
VGQTAVTEKPFVGTFFAGAGHTHTSPLPDNSRIALLFPLFTANARRPTSCFMKNWKD